MLSRCVCASPPANTPTSSPSETASDVEPEQEHVAIAHDVVAAFNAVVSGFPGMGDGTLFEQVLAVDGFGFDEASLEVSVNGAGGFDRRIAGVDGPGADFLL